MNYVLMCVAVSMVPLASCLSLKGSKVPEVVKKEALMKELEEAELLKVCDITFQLVILDILYLGAGEFG